MSESAEVGSTVGGVLSFMVLELRILKKEENAQQGAGGFLLHQKLELEWFLARDLGLKKTFPLPKSTDFS